MKISRLRAAALLVATLLMIPAVSFARKVESLYEYVHNVFSRLQINWEEQTYEKRLSNSLLTFTLNEDGKIVASNLEKSPDDQGSAQEAMNYLKESAPFGRLPEHLRGSQLEFKFKFTPESLQMMGYQVLDEKRKPTMPSPVSFSTDYGHLNEPGARRQWQPWDAPEQQTEGEQAMAAYVDEVETRIRAKWELPEEQPFQRRAVALIQIDRDGSLLGAHIKESSGDKTIDKLALKAIFDAGPFQPVPTAFKTLPVQVEYIFDPTTTQAEN